MCWPSFMPVNERGDLGASDYRIFSKPPDLSKRGKAALFLVNFKPRKEKFHVRPQRIRNI